MADVDLLPCGECGMPCRPDEYHPFAACLMFKACHNSETVRANMEALRAEVAEWKRVSAAQAELHDEAEASAERLAEALRLIASPKRPDGTWNRDREACRQIAENALRDHDQEGK